MSAQDGRNIKDTDREVRLYTTRMAVAALLALVAVLALVGRLTFLQVLNHEHYQALSTGNRVKIEPIPPTRGLISDRNGIRIADNLPSFQLEITPEDVDDLDETLARLSHVISLSEGDLERFRRDYKRHRRFEPVPLKYQLTEQEVAQFAVQRQFFAGVDVRARLARRYPLGSIAAHTVGYVASLNQRDLERLESARYAGTTHTGRTGIERALEDTLQGRPGYRQILVNAQGRSLKTLKNDPPQAGRDIMLTLDVRVQRAAASALQGRRGAIAAVSPKDGSVIALYSSPAFDPNLFGTGLSQAQYDLLVRSDDKPLFNRALQGAYPPGSTIKPILGLAGLTLQVADSTEAQWCPGYFQLPGDSHRYRDWKPQGHGHVNLRSAIEQSCDVYFYELATRLGVDVMHEFLTGFGLGSRSGLNIGSEHAGLVPSTEWKRTAFRRRADQVWFPGETVIAGIGQGYMLSTPLQLARATAILGARGERYAPRIVEAVRDEEDGRMHAQPPQKLAPLEATPEAWQQVLLAMQGVVHGQRGSARAMGRSSPYLMAGKSGTAQVFTVAQDDEYDEEEIAEALRDHAWFVAFAPFEDPQIAVAVIVENGGSGSRVAAPIARTVMDAFLLPATPAAGTVAGQ
ncbi:MAG: penicillin-binding protein 2 [Pseudomonadota bacterium]